jgi:hypothetical protein
MAINLPFVWKHPFGEFRRPETYSDIARSVSRGESAASLGTCAISPATPTWG